jgi:hypothetical protein
LLAFPKCRDFFANIFKLPAIENRKDLIIWLYDLSGLLRIFLILSAGASAEKGF